MKPSKILILTHVPPEFYVRGEFESKSLVPTFQVQHLWVDALERLGHQVILSRYDLIHANWDWSRQWLGCKQWMPRWWQRYKHLRNKMYRWWIPNILKTRRICHIIDDYSPDVILITGGISHLTARFFDHCYNRGIKIVLLHGEHPMRSATSFERTHSQDFDAIVTNDPAHATSWKNLGALNAWSGPYAAAPSQYLEIHSHQSIPLLCIASLTSDRLGFLKEMILIDPDLPLHLYGYVPEGVIIPESLTSHYRGEAWGDEVVKLYSRAKIAINLQPDHMPVGANMRTFEIPALGPVMVTNRIDATLFSETEVVVAPNPKQMVKEITTLLHDKRTRARIATAARKKVKSEHTYEHRFAHILERL